MPRITRIIILNPYKVNVYDADKLLGDEGTVLIRVRKSAWNSQPPLEVIEGEPISDEIVEKILRVAEPRKEERE